MDAGQGSAKPLISAIVPVYNVEKYLDRCVESLVNQTYGNLEILLVDDGSPDSSPALCDAWAARDERIVVIHKPNGGLSDARNVGVQQAKGEYVGFVDSDDYVAPDMYEALYTHLAETDSQIALCGVADVYEDHVEQPPFNMRAVMTSEEALFDMFTNRTLTVCVPPRLYPAWLAREIVSPVGKTHEDSFTVVDYFSRVDRVAVDLTPRYFYWHAEGTITTNPKTKARQDLIEAWDYNLELVKQQYPSLLGEVLFRCYWAHFDVLDGIYLSNCPDEQRKQAIIDYLKQNKDAILACPYMSAKRKISLRMLCLNEKLYRALVLAQNKSIHYHEEGVSA